MKTRVAVFVVCLLCLCGIASAQFSPPVWQTSPVRGLFVGNNIFDNHFNMLIEADFKVLSLKNSGTLSQDTGDINIQDDLGIPASHVAKELSVRLRPVGGNRLRYSYMFPSNLSEWSTPNKQIILNGMTFGQSQAQSQSAGNSQKQTPLWSELGYSEHRFELDLLNWGDRWGYVYPVVFSELIQPSFTIRGQQQTSGTSGSSNTSTSASNTIVEAHSNVNRFLVGPGVAGYCRERQIVLKYEVAYAFGSGSARSLFVDIDIRYDTNKGFAGAGYRYEDWSVDFDNTRLKSKREGPYIEVGFPFSSF